MIPRPKTMEPTWAPGTRVRVTHHVRVGHRQWTTTREGTVLSESLRPIGGMEMGAKARKTIVEQYDWRIVVKEAMKVYDEALS